MFTAGTRIGPFEIVSRIGAGGMGEVFRARDTRLDRSVAIKVLPPEFASNDSLKQRFEREARSISQLNHPHICTLHDVGSHDGVAYLVMELIEGETLAERVARGPLPLPDVFKYGAQIAEALHAAHRAGIIHRDLKPGNVMITKSGAKLLDFGLAKPGVAALQMQQSELATEHKPLTQEGTLLGTFQYMAPEQLEGLEADARTDIFALGEVLYEMATGRRPFEGKSRTSLIAAIVDRDPPPISRLQPLTPPGLERLVATCLAKDPDERWQSAHDVAVRLKEISSAAVGDLPQRSARRGAGNMLAWTIALLSAVSAIALAVKLRRPAGSALPVVAAINEPNAEQAALSPNGTMLAYVARGDESSPRRVYVRPLGASASRALDGTDGASYPFWSPDGRFLAFFSAGKLNKIAVSGGAVQTLCEAPRGRGGSWSSRGEIIFAPNMYTSLYRVAASGGEPRPLTAGDDANRLRSHRWPAFLPDGNRFVYFSRSGARDYGIYAGSLDSRERKLLVRAASNAAVTESGRLIFYKDGTLQSQKLDVKASKVVGEMVPIAERVAAFAPYDYADFTVSKQGVIVYKEATPRISQLLWVDRKGNTISTVTPPGNYGAIRLAPGGERFVVQHTSQSGGRDLWLYETSAAAPTRFTFLDATMGGLLWSSRADAVIFGAADVGGLDIFRKSIDGASEAALLRGAGYKIPQDASPDGRHVVIQQAGERTGWDLFIFDVQSRSAPKAWAASRFNETSARVSPDGRWIAYTSDESGRPEVYVRSFSGGGAKVRVSADGGRSPMWRGDGQELFYVTGADTLWSVSIRKTEPFQIASPPVKLFTVPIAEPFDFSAGIEPAPDGQRFLVVTSVGSVAPKPLVLMLNRDLDGGD